MRWYKRGGSRVINDSVLSILIGEIVLPSISNNRSVLYYTNYYGFWQQVQPVSVSMSDIMGPETVWTQAILHYERQAQN
jgi:hypothetical protein